MGFWDKFSGTQKLPDDFVSRERIDAAKSGKGSVPLSGAKTGQIRVNPHVMGMPAPLSALPGGTPPTNPGLAASHGPPEPQAGPKPQQKQPSLKMPTRVGMGGTPEFGSLSYDVSKEREADAYKRLFDYLENPDGMQNPVSVDTDKYLGNKNVHAGIGFAGAMSKLLAGLGGNETLMKGVDAMADYGQSTIMRRFLDAAANGQITAAPVGLETEQQSVVRQLAQDAQARSDRFDEARRAEMYSALSGDAQAQDRWDLGMAELEGKATLQENIDKLKKAEISSDNAYRSGYLDTMNRGQDMDLIGKLAGGGGRGTTSLDPGDIEKSLQVIQARAMQMFPDNEDKRNAYIEQNSKLFDDQLRALGLSSGVSPATRPDMTLIRQLLGGR